MQRLLVCWVCVYAALCGIDISAARAGSFDASPITVTLTPPSSTGMIVLTNKGTEAARFHVSAFAWNEQPDGKAVLTPTRDLLFFPAMLNLNPGEGRKIRVGVTIPPGSLEKTYRVFVQELPKLVKNMDQSTAAVSMLTKMGIPVFFEPAANRKVVPAVSGLGVTGKSLQFSATNRGTVHYKTAKLTVSVKDSTKVIFTKSINGWYVLAGGYRAYTVELPESVCAGLKSVQVDLESNMGKATAKLPTARCGP